MICDFQHEVTVTLTDLFTNIEQSGKLLHPIHGRSIGVEYPSLTQVFALSRDSIYKLLYSELINKQFRITVIIR